MNAMTTSSEPRTEPTDDTTRVRRVTSRFLTDRVLLLALLIVLLLVTFTVLDGLRLLVAPFDLRYLSTSLISLVPLALLALAQTFVILSGRSGIDLSVGGAVSLSGMVFGALVVSVGLPVAVAAPLTVVFSTLLGALNGVLVGYLRFPPLIATLATGYVFGSIALVTNGGAPFTSSEITALNGLTRGIVIGPFSIPAHVLTLLVPCLLISWFALERTRWGRSLFAVGTNDVAARYASQNVAATRASAYAVSGLLCGIAALVNVAQFASARPDAGTAGNGLALPAITIAVLGGVAIQGGIGRIGGAGLAALFIVWLNAAVLITVSGSLGPRIQLLALGVVLIGSVLLNTYANRRTGLRE